MHPAIEGFFDPITGTLSYVVYDQPGGRAAIVDSVLDYDPKSGKLSSASVDRLLEFLRSQDLTVEWHLETHLHADHITAAYYLRQRIGGKIAISRRIGEVQQVFKALFHLDPAFPTDGSQFDHLFGDDETFAVGSLTGRALAVPGHTPADMAYQFAGAVFVGDSLFAPDLGSARCDFPGGDARLLYRSVRRLLDLPDDTLLYLCHDYPSAERAVIRASTVAEQRRGNIHLRDEIEEADFVRLRATRDATLALPLLFMPSTQINIRAGAPPDAETNGVAYLKIPLSW